MESSINWLQPLANKQPLSALDKVLVGERVFSFTVNLVNDTAKPTGRYVGFFLSLLPLAQTIPHFATWEMI